MDTLVTPRTITSQTDMINTVLEDYKKYDAELSSLHFNFNVHMRGSEILKAYSVIQKIVNGDIVIRVNKKGKRIPLSIGTEDEYYEGNCQTFLESFNKKPDFLRITDEDEIVEFIFA